MLKNKLVGLWATLVEQVILFWLLRDVPKERRSPFKIILTNSLNQTRPLVFKMRMFMARINKRAYEILDSYREVFSVQPMSGLTSAVYSLQYTDKSSEDDPTPHITLEVLQDAVLAKSHKLKLNLTREGLDDALSNSDIRGEVIEACAIEAVHEIVTWLLCKIYRESDPVVHEYNLAAFDRDRNLLFTLNKTAHEMAARNRRGSGNVIITTPIVAALFEYMPLLTFKKATPDYTLPLSKAGELYNGDRLVYTVYVTLTPLCDNSNGDDLLMLYKSPKTEIDTGFIYAPYVPVGVSGTYINPETFETNVVMTTRGAEFAIPSAKNYVRCLKVAVTNEG